MDEKKDKKILYHKHLDGVLEIEFNLRKLEAEFAICNELWDQIEPNDEEDANRLLNIAKLYGVPQCVLDCVIERLKRSIIDDDYEYDGE